MKNLLVTGAAGFIGSHVCEEALSNGWKVIGIDNFFRGKREYLPVNKNFIFEEVDLMDVEALKSLIERYRPEMVLHYAAINGTEYFYEKPWQVLDTNISTTMNLLKIFESIDYRPKKILYASSSEIYGEYPKIIPTDEKELITLDIKATRDSYASAKAIDEFLVKNFCKENNIDYLILRIFNTYGPRMDTSKYGQVVPEFIKKALGSDPFTIIGNGQHTRSFCFVKDHSRIAMYLAQNISDIVINIGNDRETKILDLASMICDIVKKPFNPIFSAPRINDPLRRCPNIDNLTKIVEGPKYSLKEGLRETVKWYQNHT